ncbi:MAG: DNA replication and repair protein RecF [Eggerthellaceae bacterium]|nr:DNA replication and repair protein RecF [Eggerthellaceae bacterium]
MAMIVERVGESLRIESLAFADFRNYERFSLDGIGDLTIFVGPNAVGKTNVLEGIQLLTSASSFRHPQVSQLVREGADSARISMEVTDGNRRLSTALSLEPGKKKFTINGKAKGAADVRGVLPSVMFTPDDLELAKKSSSVKRDAVDDLGVQLTRNYYIVRRDYEKTIRYKNRLLRDEASRALVESINETLVTCGAQLFCYRAALFDRLVPHVARVYGDIAREGEAFSASYVPSWMKVAEGDVGTSVGEAPRERDVVRGIMAESLERFYGEERARRRSLIGPHNDQIGFALAGRDASVFASQGQQRSIVLAWKLAEVELTREVLGVSPVLLLDDVLSELDASRREMLVGFVTDDVQTFVTATDLDGFAGEMVERAQLVELPRSVSAPLTARPKVG